MGLVKVYATVENEKRIPSQYRGAKIRGWVGLSPEYTLKAKERYLEFFRKDQPTIETNAQADNSERDYQAILEKVVRNEIKRRVALDALVQFYNNPSDRISVLDRLTNRLNKERIKLWQ
jgi:hypothetical protein